MDAAANPSHALALVLVDELARCGVTDAVLAPGSRSTALAMALHDDPRLRLHVEIDERSAGFLAVGLARASGLPAVVVVTSGSAVANLHPAVVEADTGRVPLLLCTADRPPELRHTGANQAIDQLGIFGRAVRWFVELGVPEDRPTAPRFWRSTLSRAVAETLGLSGPPGPVHANLAFHEPTVPATDDGRFAAPGPYRAALTGRSDARPYTAVRRAPRLLDDDTLDGLAARIATTERGLVVVGQTTAAPEPILALADAAGWPVIAEPASGARLDNRVVASAAWLLGHPGFVRRHTPDLVLRIGRTGLSRGLAGLLGPHVPQLLLDPDGAWADPERAVAELLVADVVATCMALADRLGLPASSDYATSWYRADAAVRGVVHAMLDVEVAPSEPRTARDVAATLPDGATLVVASSMPIRDLDLTLVPRRGLRILANRGASGIDGFVSTALGVALASAGPVVALTGDLSLLHDANGLLLAPDTDRLDATFVVVDNDGGGIFSFLPQAAYPGPFERVFATPHGRDLAALARLHHLRYTPLATADALPDALRGAIAGAGLQLLHVRTDRTENLALHRRLRAAANDALDVLGAASS